MITRAEKDYFIFNYRNILKEFQGASSRTHYDFDQWYVQGRIFGFANEILEEIFGCLTENGIFGFFIQVEIIGCFTIRKWKIISFLMEKLMWARIMYIITTSVLQRVVQAYVVDTWSMYVYGLSYFLLPEKPESTPSGG